MGARHFVGCTMAGLLLIETGCPEYQANVDPVVTVVISNEIMVDPQPAFRPVLGGPPSAALGDDQYLVVWADERAGSSVLYGGRIGVDGTTLDPYGFPIMPAPHAAWTSLSVASDGLDFLLATTRGGKIIGLRVNAAGEVLDPDGFVIAEPTQSYSRPSVLFDGEHYQVAWSEGETCQPHCPMGTESKIHRARVSPDATVVDPNGLWVGATTGSHRGVGMSWDGANTLLSWRDYDFEEAAFVISARRVAPDGTLLDDNPIRLNEVNTDIFGIGPMAATFDGSNHVIAWQEEWSTPPESDGHYRIKVNRVTPDGVVLDQHGITVGTGNFEGTTVVRMDLAGTAGHDIVVWSTTYPHGGSGTGAARITNDGVIDPLPAFANGGDATLVVHEEGGLFLSRRSTESFEFDNDAIMGTRLDTAGAPLPDDHVTPAAPASRQNVLATAFDGENFLVVWNDTRGDFEPNRRSIYGSRISADGSVHDEHPIALGADAPTLAAAVFDGANFVVLWSQRFSETVRMARVSPSGQQLDDNPKYLPVWADSHLVAASDGHRTLVVARQQGNWKNRLATVLLDQEGEVVGDVLALVGHEESVGSSAVSFTGDSYLLLWSRLSDVQGQRISTDGEPLGDRFVVFSHEPSVQELVTVRGGDTHLLVWRNNNGLFATRVGLDGQMLDPDPSLVAKPGVVQGWPSGNFPSVAFDGHDFIIGWSDQLIPGDRNSVNLHGVRVGPDGKRHWPFAVSATPYREFPMFLTSGDGKVLAAYARYVPGPPHENRRAVGRLLETIKP